MVLPLFPKTNAQILGLLGVDELTNKYTRRGARAVSKQFGSNCTFLHVYLFSRGRYMAGAVGGSPGVKRLVTSSFSEV
jgi:hypothetical protein